LHAYVTCLSRACQNGSTVHIWRKLNQTHTKVFLVRRVNVVVTSQHKHFILQISVAQLIVRHAEHFVVGSWTITHHKRSNSNSGILKDGILALVNGNSLPQHVLHPWEIEPTSQASTNTYCLLWVSFHPSYTILIITRLTHHNLQNSVSHPILARPSSSHLIEISYSWLNRMLAKLYSDSYKPILQTNSCPNGKGWDNTAIFFLNQTRRRNFNSRV